MITTAKYDPGLMLALVDIDLEKQTPEVRAGLEALAKQQRLWAELALIDVQMHVEQIYESYDIKQPFPAVEGLSPLPAPPVEPEPAEVETAAETPGK